MRAFFKTINVTLKAIVLLLRPGTWLGFLSHPALFFYNVLGMTKLLSQQKGLLINDYFTWKRDHERRYNLYNTVLEHHGLKDAAIDYLEFGVCQGHSMKWWVKANTNPSTKYYGFDTFEGLPENWGKAFKKGDMSAAVPEMNDDRVEFFTGLFQDTVPGFLNTHLQDGSRKKVIHLDADLFSSTLYALSNLSNYIKPGDILLFDEFNVPNHEYYALRIFEKTFYREFKMIGAVNNYYQTAFVVVK
jgi:O-methyltransferase